MQEYKGPISTSPDKRIQTAYWCFRNQLNRCRNPKNPRYKDNGAKGIDVYYSMREFVAWYLIEIDKFTGVAPSVGRKDHSKGYSFDNIQIESLSDNVKERIRRVGPTKPYRAVKIFKDGKLWKTAKSTFEASKLTGVQAAHMSKYCTGKLDKSVTGFSFRYAAEYSQDTLIIPKKYKKSSRQVEIYHEGTLIAIVNSCTDAQVLTGIDSGHIPKYCTGKLKKSYTGYSFKFHEAASESAA